MLLKSTLSPPVVRYTVLIILNFVSICANQLSKLTPNIISLIRSRIHKMWQIKYYYGLTE